MAENKQILLAHGDPLTSMYKRVLERFGLTPLLGPQAHNARDALEEVAETEYGLIITDACFFPGKDCPDREISIAGSCDNYGDIAKRFVRLVRKVGPNKKTPIAVLTLYSMGIKSSMACSRQGMLEAGVNEFFHMPSYSGNTGPVFKRLKEMYEGNGR